MKPPTDEEIRNEVYVQTMQETGDNIEWFIKGMIYMRNEWLASLKPWSPDSDAWIYERDGEKIYRRHFGSPHETRELING